MNVSENTIFVHEDRVAEFDDKLEKANRRLERAGIDGRFVVALVDTIEVKHKDGSIEYRYEYAINSPSFEYSGWEFLASVEVMDGGTLLRNAPGKELPEGFKRPEDHVCEYCNISRSRNKTYLLREVATGEIKQVGSSCLALFLGVEPQGLWALGFVEELEEYRESSGGYYIPSRWSIDMVLRIAFAVTEGGSKFVSKAQAQNWEGKTPSSSLVGDVLTFRESSRVSAEYRDWIKKMNADADAVAPETIAEIIAFAETLNGEYGENMRVLTNSSAVEYRHLGLLVSLVGVWHRANAKKAEQEAEKAAALNEWIGEVKVRFKKVPVTVTKLYHHEGDYGWTTKITMRDADGRTLTWWASNAPQEAEVGAELLLTATVKKHSTHEGWKITEVTRGKFDAK